MIDQDQVSTPPLARIPLLRDKFHDPCPSLRFTSDPFGLPRTLPGPIDPYLFTTLPGNGRCAGYPTSATRNARSGDLLRSRSPARPGRPGLWAGPLAAYDPCSGKCAKEPLTNCALADTVRNINTMKGIARMMKGYGRVQDVGGRPWMFLIKTGSVSLLLRYSSLEAHHRIGPCPLVTKASAGHLGKLTRHS